MTPYRFTCPGYTLCEDSIAATGVHVGLLLFVEENHCGC
jgi:hypothetical protein